MPSLGHRNELRSESAPRPFGVVPGYFNLTLLDRPFVEMTLYLPLSLIGGLGLAGLQQYLKHSTGKIGKLSIFMEQFCQCFMHQPAPDKCSFAI